MNAPRRYPGQGSGSISAVTEATMMSKRQTQAKAETVGDIALLHRLARSASLQL
jgi:hypothetical protein